MKRIPRFLLCTALLFSAFSPMNAEAQIGKRFPSERKVIKDPVTGTPLTFLTSTPTGDAKIYPTHTQWTADGEWLIFRSGRVRNEALAVNEKTGDIVQVTEGGYTGMLCIARKSMKLYFMRYAKADTSQRPRGGPLQVVEVDLQKVFTDSKKGKMEPLSVYQRVCGIIPGDMEAGGDMALDAEEDVVYFRVGKGKPPNICRQVQKWKQTLVPGTWGQVRQD